MRYRKSRRRRRRSYKKGRRSRLGKLIARGGIML